MIALRIALAVLGSTLALGTAAQGFRFSDDNEAEKRRIEEDQRQGRVQTLLATPCMAKIKNQKIMVVNGENRNLRVLT